MTLRRLLHSLATDEAARTEMLSDPAGALARAGFEDLGEDLLGTALVHHADTAPLGELDALVPLLERFAPIPGEVRIPPGFDTAPLDAAPADAEADTGPIAEGADPDEVANEAGPPETSVDDAGVDGLDGLDGLGADPTTTLDDLSTNGPGYGIDRTDAAAAVDAAFGTGAIPIIAPATRTPADTVRNSPTAAPHGDPAAPTADPPEAGLEPDEVPPSDALLPPDAVIPLVADPETAPTPNPADDSLDGPLD